MQRDRSSFLGVGGVPMHAGGRRVDHLDVAVVSLGNRVEKPTQHQAFVHTRHPARLVRQQWMDRRPLEIRQIEACHLGLPSKRLNHPSQQKENPAYGYVT
jgi:hypothetical protein